ncbi:hypothetical protein ACFYWP_41915 [Actinacidiphila glaucinigra]|uniref:hypothetical protein n=1 Tax=Actinacidiphila glaucinigra TaxID=235986 RepID=UPI0036A0C067
MSAQVSCYAKNIDGRQELVANRRIEDLVRECQGRSADFRDPGTWTCPGAFAVFGG